MNTLKKGYLMRALSVFMALMMILSLCTVGITSAYAADVTLAEVGDNPANERLLLKPNSEWKTDNARFAVYVFNNTAGKNAWVSMEVYEYDSSLYVATVPDGDWEGIIFCRMNPSTTANNWDNKWNQTGDLSYTEGQNLYTMNSGSWDTGSWSRYGVHLPGSFNEWNEYDPVSEMKLVDEAKEIYELTLELEAGSYEFKILVGNQWRSNASTITDKTSSELQISSTTDANCKLEATGGSYTFRFDRANGKLTVTHTPLENPFDFEVTVSAPKSVQVGEDIVISATANTEEDVTYTLKDSLGNTVQPDDKGDFVIATTADDENTTKTYTLSATVTVDGEEYSVTKEIEVVVNSFNFSVTLSAPSSVEAGMVITLKATAVSNSTVSYKFYTADGTPVAENNSGVYSVDATRSDIGKTKSFYVVATTIVAGKEYTAESKTVNVDVTDVTETYNVTLYFKSTSTIGYRPVITTSGAVQNLTDYSMVKDVFICKNVTQTASYYWYKAEVAVSKASPSLTVNVVLSPRYAMEATLTFTVTQSGPVYLGVDDLNSGSTMVNMTDWNEAERNWTQSAVHSVYDADLDGEDSLAAVSAQVNLTYVGDANGDGVVNIKDATLIQKSLAGLEKLDAFSTEISDADDDGVVTIKDATTIQKKIVACL